MSLFGQINLNHKVSSKCTFKVLVGECELCEVVMLSFTDKLLATLLSEFFLYF
jgi:hypothetical protein